MGFSLKYFVCEKPYQTISKRNHLLQKDVEILKKSSMAAI